MSNEVTSYESRMSPPAQLRSGNTELYLELDTLLAQDVFLQLVDLYGALGGVQQPVCVGEGEPGRRERGQGQTGLGESSWLRVRLQTLIH